MRFKSAMTAVPSQSPELEALRQKWLLDSSISHLNHGSFGACPRDIVEKQRELRERMERDPLDFLWRKLDAPLDASREIVARFVNAAADTMAFVPNATGAVNAVLRSLEFQPGDELLVTSHGYNACRNVADDVARRSGARVVVADVPFPIASPEEIVGSVLSRVTPRTRLAMLDHVTSPTAIIFPIGKLVKELAARNVRTLIDGAHAPGMIALDLDALGADYYTGNLHKWICAPRGAAFICVRKDRQEEIQPTIISHGANTHRPGRSGFHDRFDWQGTLDVTAWLCAGDAVNWCSALFPGGIGELARRNHALAVEARALLCGRFEVEPPCPDFLLGSMATLPLPARFPRREPERFDPDQTWLLERHRIEVPLMRLGGVRWLRISAHAYNSLDQYSHLADAILERTSTI